MHSEQGRRDRFSFTRVPVLTIILSHLVGKLGEPWALYSKSNICSRRESFLM